MAKESRNERLRFTMVPAPSKLGPKHARLCHFARHTRIEPLTAHTFAYWGLAALDAMLDAQRIRASGPTAPYVRFATIRTANAPKTPCSVSPIRYARPYHWAILYAIVILP